LDELGCGSEAKRRFTLVIVIINVVVIVSFMAQQQSSRLNRLLTLLDTGSTQATRLTAAKQIGDIAKSHPQDLSSLLRKVLHHLRSKKWDTRVAAAHAIGAIVLNVKHPSLSELLNSLATKLGEAGISDNVDEVVAFRNLQSKILANAPFRSFEMNKVLEFGALLASGGQEYDILNDNSKNPRDRVARQKKNLRRRLGLDMCEQFMDVNEMIRDEDLIEQKSNVPANGVGNRLYANCSPHHIQQFVSRMVPRVNSRRPSARELNLLKRKAKISSKDQAKGSCEVADVEMSSSHVASTSKRILSDSLDSSKADIGNEDDIEPDGDGKWPFHSFVEQLILDMFDPGKVHVLVPYTFYFFPLIEF
jgi:TATA-binding protein-associated factor